MTLEEAIEYNERDKQFFEKGHCPQSVEATRLGIEALKRLKECREANIYLIPGLLPGETEE